MVFFGFGVTGGDLVLEAVRHQLVRNSEFVIAFGVGLRHRQNVVVRTVGVVPDHQPHLLRLTRLGIFPPTWTPMMIGCPVVMVVSAGSGFVKREFGLVPLAAWTRTE